MRGKNFLALLSLAMIGLLAGGLILWLIVAYLPYVVALVLAFLIALVIVAVLASIVGVFGAAVAALYYSLRKEPHVGGRPLTLKDVKKLRKEEGRFEEEG